MSDSKEMSFWDHLDELRAVLIKIAVVVVAVTMGLFFVMPTVFDAVIMAPTRGDFILYRVFERVAGAIPFAPPFNAESFHVDIISIKLASQFFIHISTSFWLGLVVSFPVILYFLWQFIAPALYEGERRGTRIAFSLATVMFYLGAAVGYFVVFPVTLRFLADYHVSASIANQISIDSYIDTFMMLIFVMGLVFELPLLSWSLSAIGVLRRSFFATYRRHAIVALLILAALITPTGDPFTLMIVFLPIYLLYEASALLVKK